MNIPLPPTLSPTFSPTIFRTISRPIALAAGLSWTCAWSASGTALSLPVLDNIGCAMFSFFTGTMAVWAFVLVTTVTLLVGLVARIDFSKLIATVVVFGLLTGLGKLLVTNGQINAASCISSSSGT